LFLDLNIVASIEIETTIIAQRAILILQLII